MRDQITTHFFRHEFDCHTGDSYPEGWIDDRLLVLCAMLEDIRGAWGAPLFIVSGYRTSAYNKKIGGARLSQHVQGRAADIRPTHNTPDETKRLHDLILGRHLDGNLPQLGGLGLYHGWVHVDVRARVNDHLARWTGGGIGSET